MPKIFRVLIPSLFIFLLSACGCGERTAPDERVEIPEEPHPESMPTETPEETASPEIPEEPHPESMPTETPEETASPEIPEEPHPESMPTETPEETASPEIPEEPMLSGISLPGGFSISLYSNEVPGARSLALGADGTLFIGTSIASVLY